MIEVSSNDAISQIDNLVEKSISKQITILIIGLLIVITLIIFFPRIIVKPLKNLLDRMEDISDGEGDLTARVTV